MRKHDIIEPVGTLLPCPFCGGEAFFGYLGSLQNKGENRLYNHSISIDGGIWVGCNKCPTIMGHNCGCDYDDTGDFKTFGEAEESWNHRA